MVNKNVLNCVKLDFKQYIHSYKWILILGMILILNYHCKVTLAEYSLQLGMEFNMFDYILSLLLGNYYLVYFFIPLFVFLIIPLSTSRLNTESLIRLNSTNEWLVSKIINSFLVSILFVGSILLISLLTSIGVPYESNWSLLSISQMLEPLNIIVPSFENPISATIISSVLLILGFTLLGIILTVSYLFIRKSKFFLLPLIFIWLMAMLGMRVSYDSLPNIIKFMFLNSNLLLSDALAISSNGGFIALLNLIVFNLGIILLGKYRLKNMDLVMEKKL